MGLLDVINANRVQEFKLYLSSRRRVVILCHARPDGDAIGSAVGLGLMLVKYGYQVHCIAPSGVPAPLSWLEGRELLVEYEREVALSRHLLREAELLIFVDMNDLGRLDASLASDVQTLTVPRIMIDHHLQPSDEFDLKFSFPESSSTCELMYELMCVAWSERDIDPPIANALYMGLMTDTGSFAHSCSRRRTFEVAGALVALGADVPNIRSHVLGSFSEERVRLYGYAMSKRMKILANGRAGLISLTRYSLDQYDYAPGDTEGLVNEPLTIRGVDLSILLTERNVKSVRVSIRSRNGLEVNSFAREKFNGGGHAQASGGMLRMQLREAIAYTEAAIEEYFQAQRQGENVAPGAESTAVLPPASPSESVADHV